jgi:carboxypeptidase Q
MLHRHLNFNRSVIPSIIFQMRKNFVLFVVAIYMLPLLVRAQDNVDMAMMQKIKDEEANNSQVTAIAHTLLEMCGPRLTNSPGYRRAVDWTVKQLKQWGLNATPEAWGEFGRGWSNEGMYVAMKKPYYQPIIAYPKAWTNGTSGAITAKLVLLERLDSATITAMGTQLAGRIVMVRQALKALRSAFVPDGKRYEEKELNALPNSMNMIPAAFLDIYVRTVTKDFAVQKYLQSTGALALLMVNTAGRDGTLFVEGTPAFSTRYSMPMPEVLVSTEDYMKLQRLADDKKDVELEMNINNKWYTDNLQGYNVIGEIPGTDPTLKAQVVMLGAHLDAWHTGTGATDNGAGCVVMMEAMRILKALGVQPRRTIRIALWGAEEQGLLGSFGYVKKHFGNPINMHLSAEQKNISAYFNLDNGSGKIRGIYAQKNIAAKPIFESWLKPFADMGATAVTLSNTGATDHLSFDAVGIPGFQFIQDPLEYEPRTHHTNMDVYDHLQIDDLKQAAVVVAGFIYNAAMRDEMIPRKPLPKAGRFVFDTDDPL